MLEWRDEVRRQLDGLRLDPARENEIVDELARHLEDRYREFQAAGLTEDQAYAAALRELTESGLLSRRMSMATRFQDRPPLPGSAPGGVPLIELVSYNLPLLRLKRLDPVAGLRLE
jgi:hypothetical protein